jgi:immune inhibitor A
LSENGYSERFSDIFADFLIANYLNDPTAGGGHWGYENLSLSPPVPAERHSVYPVDHQSTVFQYGGDYITLTGRGNLAVDFSGSTQVNVVDNNAHSGQYQWYSHRGDDSNSRLTGAFDLSRVDTATLNYWTWYDIESDWDYGYVEISTDGGRSWTILQAPYSATDNPSGNAYGPGYTGTSGGNEATWLEESVDLSGYAGQEVLIRFEYVTDDAVNRPGWTIDDISIPEIGFFDNVESGQNEWTAEGFVRIDNILPQQFIVQVLEIGQEVNVRAMTLDETNRGRLTITGLGDIIDEAVLIVSGLAPITSQPASYEYKVAAVE